METMLIGVFVLVVCSSAYAHDPKRPELDKWFDNLQSPGNGLCCHGKEAQELDDSDWETKDNHYRVRLKDGWHDVPDKAVVNGPNLAGRAWVWVLQVHATPRYGQPSNYQGPQSVIRCFMPGTFT
jgi:hypothetical protein